jgi:hypothetical protein
MQFFEVLDRLLNDSHDRKSCMMKINQPTGRQTRMMPLMLSAAASVGMKNECVDVAVLEHYQSS